MNRFCSAATRFVAVFLVLVTVFGIFGFVAPISADAATYESEYFPKYYGSSQSIVTALQSLGINSSYSYRCRIAAVNSIQNYAGRAAENTRLLQLLKQGKLRNPDAKVSTNPGGGSDSGSNSNYTFIWGTGSDMYYRVTKSNAPLRESKSDSAKVIVKLARNQLVKVTSVEKNWKGNSWLKVSYKNSAGKVCNAYLYAGNASKYGNKVNAMRSYAKQLYGESDIYRVWGISVDRAMELANTANKQSTVKTNLQNELKQKLDKAVGKAMNVSSYKTNTYYSYYDYNGVYRKNWGLYQKSGGCTWYAFNRFRQVNGSDLLFRGAGGGDAKYWDDRIVTSSFNKISAGSISNGLTNAVGVDNQGSPHNGKYYGHVVYIELVINGYVYYSEGWYNSSGFHSRLAKCSIQSFANKYETVIIPRESFPAAGPLSR